jgi:hypothetical protein
MVFCNFIISADSVATSTEANSDSLESTSEHQARAKQAPGLHRWSKTEKIELPRSCSTVNLQYLSF